MALARALSIEPEALLLDEPLSALDTHLRGQVEAELQETFAAYRRPTLLVTHNIEEAYRLGDQLLVLARGRIAASGPKEEIFRHPPSLEVAQLTGCKNFSRVRPISDHLIEALDWGCQLRVAHTLARPAGHVGIRAHHIDFVEPSEQPRQLQAPRTSSLAGSRVPRKRRSASRSTCGCISRPRNQASIILQAEVFKEKWERFRNRPQPWHVRLSPDSLFLLPE